MTTTTMFNQAEIEAQEREEEDQRNKELEEEERKREEETEEQVRRQVANVSLNLEESDDSENENDSNAKQRIEFETPEAGRRNPNHQPHLTSTPYHHNFDIDEGPLMEETPERFENPEERYLQARSQGDRLEILYEARGHELVRLREEVERLREENESKNRSLSHEVAMLKAENHQMKVKVEQMQELYQEGLNDNANLRNENDMLQNALQKQEKSKEDLIARSESADHLIQSLQNQLIELQKKDTVLKAREHHDALVSSLKERHESEVNALRQEVDRLTAQNKRYDHEMDQLRNKMNETQRYHESMLVEKSERIEELSRRLADTQKRLTELITSNTTNNQDLESRIGDPVKEICTLKANLASLNHQRNEQEKVIMDLSDQLAEMQTQLDEARNKASSTGQKEVLQLKQETAKKEKEIELLRGRERELSKQNDQMKRDISNLQTQIDSISKLEHSNQVALDQCSSRMIENLRKEVQTKDEELSSQQNRIENLISQWQAQAEYIKNNHGKEAKELMEVKEKYKKLKDKTKAFQKHFKSVREHHIKENMELRESFNVILHDYKSKMELASEQRDKNVEIELFALKRQFDTELQKLDEYQGNKDNNPPSLTISNSSRTERIASTATTISGTRPKKICHSSSDEENLRPTSARSQELARLCEKTKRDAINSLKKPPSSTYTEFQNPLSENRN